ncbi:nuA3 HAT complex component nto1 [Tulasnella sp. 418]|nr:nuA3 HAT complex component nto1 [Tulasnella sp. 418]
MVSASASAKSKDSKPLPVISFRKVEEDGVQPIAGVHDQQARSYGYNHFKPFERPDYYIRHIEPIEAELATQVEYDMDEQDQEWLDAMNADRKKEQVDQVTYEVFEIIMDRLEKEWFDLMKHVPKPEMALPAEDSSCSICDDGEAENSNAILFCDGCNLAVHQDCYGVPYIPEGQWLCRKCTLSPEAPVSCMFCPNGGGAFKQTLKGQWAHLLCAIWIPEVTVGNQTIMEPIEGIEHIPKSRWKLICSICKDRSGACIQCDVKTCYNAFHVSCARKSKLLMAMKSLPGQEAEIQLKAYCERHLPKQIKELREAASPTPEHEQVHSPASSSSRLPGDSPSSPTHQHSNVNQMSPANKSARAYAARFSSGPPLVPNVIVERIMSYIGKVTVRKKMMFVPAVCKYWSLKREARRGAPLLKRLHLEPWTSSNGNRQHTDLEKAKKLEHLSRLRKDLERVRMLAELTRKREREKLRQAQIVQNFISSFFFPFDEQMRQDDINLVLDNAMKYHDTSTAAYRTAVKIKTAAGPLLEKLERQVSQHKPLLRVEEHQNATQQDAEASGIHSNVLSPSVGDLEPSLQALELLLSEQSIADSLDFFLPQSSDPLTSFMSFEMDVPKPHLPQVPPDIPVTSPEAIVAQSTPPPEVELELELEPEQTLEAAPKRNITTLRKNSKPQKSRAPRDPEAEKERRRRERAERNARENGMVLDDVLDVGTAGGFRARTRGARAAALAIKEDMDQESGEHATVESIAQEPQDESGAVDAIGEDDEGAFLAEPEESEPTRKLHTSAAPISKDSIQDDVPEEPALQPTDAETAMVAEPIAVDAPDQPVPTTPPKSKHKSPSKSKKDKGKSKAPPTAPSTDEVAPQSNLPPAEINPRKRKRTDAVEDSPVLPPVVEDVGNHDSFLLFNQGWVLPSGSRRREKVVLPPLPKKRDPKRSRLSVAATSPSENMTLQSAAEQSSPSNAQTRESMNVDEPAMDLQQQQQVTESHENNPPHESHRRNAPERRTQEDLSSELSSAASSIAGEKQPTEAPEVVVKEDVDSSELSESGSEESHLPPNSGRGSSVKTDSTPRAESQANAPSNQGGSVVSSAPPLVEGQLEGGTLVWAKMESYPWFPAVVFEDDDDSIPTAVLRGKQQAETNAKDEVGPFNIIQFFDTTNSWNWLPPSKIKLLGEDKGETYQSGDYIMKLTTRRSPCKTSIITC